MIALTFLGAARTVTGSKYLLEVDDQRILIDAGLFQGLKELRRRNWEALPIDAERLTSVVLTHAHLDHSGYLPRLASDGFRGRVFCTAGTAELCRLVLPDAGRIQEEDARAANRGGYTRHSPALPLFTEPDAYRALSLFQPVGYNRPLPAAPGVEVEFVNAGHLLGSAYARITVNRSHPCRLLFSGDLGRYDRPVLPDPSPIEPTDVLLVESTYGDRVHTQDDQGEQLAHIVTDTVKAGGKVIIPSFAIGRVEEVLYWLNKLEEAKRIPVLPIYLDSPMAIGALKYYVSRSHELDPDVRSEHGRVCAFCTARFKTVESHKDSLGLVSAPGPAIVVSSSGMATGGRVLHHLAQALPDPRNTILFVGYQAAGTRGRRLVDGESKVKIHGQYVPVAARIERIDSMSAHADSGEIFRWLHGLTRAPSITFTVHGEPEPMDVMKQRLEQDLGWVVRAPEYLERVEIDAYLA